jgi:hypothetical protein
MERHVLKWILLAALVLPARDGQHDFDFGDGTWHTHVRRLQHELTGSTTWLEYDGKVVSRKVWGGKAHLEELEVDGPTGHIEGLTLRLYDPKAHQWSLNFASSSDGTIGTPLIGAFQDGRGEFIDQESFGDRTIMVRHRFFDITPSSHHFEQAFSDDRGKTWEPNWVATLTPTTGSISTDTAHQHDFDFNIGTWRTHIKRLMHPLTGSTTWVDYQGTHTVRKVWNGRANIGELEVDGPGGHLEVLSLRLYNPQSHQWSLNFANSGEGKLGQPGIGEFNDGRGEFYDQETFNGRAILVRSVWSDITPTSSHLEQAFSVDGGKTWEVNWVAADTLVQADAR